MKKNILWIFAMVALLVGCAANTVDDEKQTKETKKDNPAQQGTTFIGGIDIKPNVTSATRTSLSMTYPGGTQVDYFWEKGDTIWTADGTKGGSQITTKSATAKFYLSRGYDTPTVTLYYPGKYATKYNKVMINTSQRQKDPNVTDSLGIYGDCGTATAHQQSDKTYSFNLDHKAAFICFLPYSENHFLPSVHVRSIKVTADHNIAGTYTLTPTGLTGSGTANSITLYLGGNFKLTNTTPSQATNASYMVIAPGTHQLTVEYELAENSSAYASGKIIKTINSHTYAANTVTPITVDLTIKDFSDRKNNFYLWDAQNNYWYNEATNSQFPNIPTAYGEKNENYPKLNTDSRWYNPSETPATNSCKNCPSFAAMTWYAYAGDPHTEQILFAYNGHLLIGGVWFKKWNNITATDANGNTKSTTVPYNNLPPDKSESDYPQCPAPATRPAGALWDYKNGELPGSQYFFLPSLGYINQGEYSPGSGCYWTSTPYKKKSYEVYSEEANHLYIVWGRLEFNRSAVPRKYIAEQIWTMQ